MMDRVTYRLEVEIQRPVLRIRSQPARVSIRQQQATFQVSRRQARMQVQRQQASFRIDRSNSSWAVNQTPILSLLQQLQSESVQKGLEAIGRIASEGDRLARIYQRHQTMARIVTERLNQSGQLNLVAVPRPDMTWDPGGLDIEWTPFEQELIWQQQEPVRLEVTPHQVTVDLEKMPHIRFRFVAVKQERRPDGRANSPTGLAKAMQLKRK